MSDRTYFMLKCSANHAITSRGSKNLTLWRKFNCCTDETLCYYLLDF